MQNLDDITLLREYVERDSQEAFATLVSRHINKVYSVALRQSGNAHSAEEITQAVFVILARKSRRLAKGVVLSGWLYHTARLASLTFVRSEIRRTRRELEAHLQSTSNENEPVLWTQIAPLLDTAMARLNETDRHAIVLRYFDGKSMRQVGAELGTSEDAAKVRVNRAVEKLRRFFHQRSVNAPVTELASAISANSVQPAPVALIKTATALALVKGAAASASTLTLINGALKVMAWTKAKTAVMATLAVILTAGTGVVLLNTIHSLRAGNYPDIQGAWEGTMHFDAESITAGEASSSRMVLKLTKTNGIYYATADWIEKSRKDIPLGPVVYDYPTLEIQRNLRDKWKLTVNKDASQMVLDHTIHFIQPDPVTLTRTTTPDPVPEPLTESNFAPRENSDLQGYWKGIIGTGPTAVPVNLKIAEQPDGTFRAEGDDPMRGATSQPVNVSYDRPTVKLTLASAAGTFRGTINSVNSEISGTWIQGGRPTPAKLTRADYRAEHAQDALKDYSFNSPADLQGHWQGKWICPVGDVTVTIREFLDIAKMPDGTFLATFTNPDEFGYDAPIPASDFQYSPPNLRMKWKWAEVAYEGKLENGKLVGTWFQGGGGFPLVLERTK